MPVNLYIKFDKIEMTYIFDNPYNTSTGLVGVYIAGLQPDTKYSCVQDNLNTSLVSDKRGKLYLETDMKVKHKLIMNMKVELPKPPQPPKQKGPADN